MKFMFPLFLLVLLTNCASVEPDAYDRIAKSAEDQDSARVFLFRDHSVQAGLAKAYVALDGEYLASLEQNQYAELVIPAGQHELKARAHGSVASSQSVALTAGKTTCLEVRPNTEDIGLLMVPFINALVPSFVISEADCPSPSTLAGYSNAI